MSYITLEVIFVEIPHVIACIVISAVNVMALFIFIVSIYFLIKIR